MTTSVYWIHHPDHSDMLTQGYIGVSKRAEVRWSEHLKKSQNPHLKNAIAKYGWDNLVKKVILVADEAYCLMIEAKLRALDGIGWNIVKGGGKPPVAYGNKSRLGSVAWNKGKKTPPETIEKLRLAHLGQEPGNKGMKGVQVAWNKGTRYSDERKARMVGQRKGYKHSPETIQKIREAQTGEAPYKMTDEIKNKISESLKMRNKLLTESKEK
jgi:hypothetical protein